MKIEECPITHLSLCIKLRQHIDAGILQEHPIYHPGFGKGTYITYKGNKIKIKRKVKGLPRWKNGVPADLYFDEFYDVAYDPLTSTLLVWAKSI